MTWQQFRDNATPADAGRAARDDLDARFSGRVEARPALGRLVGAGVRDEPVHRWVPYKEAFSPQLVRVVLDQLGIHRGHLIDPFAGVGTSLLVAAERHMTATGVELLPWPAFAATTKLAARRARAGRVTAIAAAAAADRRPIRPSFPDFPVRDWAFTPPVLAELSRFGLTLSEAGRSFSVDVARLAFLATIEEVSQATKDGTSLRRRVTGRRPGRWGTTWTRPQVRAAFVAKAAAFAAELRAAPPAGAATCVVGDARALPAEIRRGDATVAVFSPPYPNRYDYVGNYQLELGFGFVDTHAGLRTLRQAQLRSHLEASWPQRRTLGVDALDEFLCALLASRRSGDETGRVFRMVAGYMEDMAAVFGQLADAVRPGGSVAVVVGTQVFAGEALPTDLILAAIAEDVYGWNLKSCLVARTKGVASQQRARYGTIPGSRESVLLFEL
jgi:hypothetical protein